MLLVSNQSSCYGFVMLSIAISTVEFLPASPGSLKVASLAGTKKPQIIEGKYVESDSRFVHCGRNDKKSLLGTY